MNLVSFGSICKLQNGRAFKPSEWSSEGIPIVRIQNLNDETKPFNYCDFEVDEKFHIDTGDLLFSWSGTPGTSFGAFFWNRGKGYLNQHIFRVDIDESKVDKSYLRYAINSKLVHIIDQAHGGVGLKHITKGKLEAVEIPLPSLNEQKRIAAVLDKADAIRRKRQQAILLADEFLRSVFLDMYGDPFRNPNGWDVYKMKDVIEFKGGNQPPKSTFEHERKPGYIRLIQIRDFKSNKYPTYIPEELAKRKFSKDDVMIARYGPPVFQILRGLEGSYNVALMKAIPKGKITKEFIYRLLQVPAYHDVVVANSERTAGQSGVNLDLLNNFDVPLPPLSVQKKIIHRVVAMEKLIRKMNKARYNCDELFASLNQKAFAGEL
ncbi:MAG: restriction endonuclease subunit S [Candidatus Thiodiazotropha taylori]|nr:restriction endonuclease subunit S [Candidatus Thiodiazotropha taylori]